MKNNFPLQPIEKPSPRVPRELPTRLDLGHCACAIGAGKRSIGSARRAAQERAR
ncbi:MAG: hypothetical protein AB1773_00470 [Pseudomonadota bacterium]